MMNKVKLFLRVGGLTALFLGIVFSPAVMTLGKSPQSEKPRVYNYFAPKERPEGLICIFFPSSDLPITDGFADMVENGMFVPLEIALVSMGVFMLLVSFLMPGRRRSTRGKQRAYYPYRSGSY